LDNGYVVARARRDSKLDSRAAREKLAPSGKPYYRSVDLGLHVGYRKGRNGGRWVLRRYVGDERYIVETIATADDFSDADGVDILNFYQAQARAREISAKHQGAIRDAGPLTVSRVLDAYLDRLDAQHSKTAVESRSRAEHHIRPKLGKIPVADLSREMIARWLKEMAERPRHVRGKKGASSRALEGPKTDDQRRRRRASANRTLTILRAALNQAFREGKITSDTAWRTVKPFREVDSARVRYLSHDEIRRLVNAAQGEFRTLVNAALFTGCRYGELTRLRVGDFNPDTGTVFVAQSKSGKARHVILSEEGQRFFAQITAGRSNNSVLLPKAGGEPWGYSHQLRPMRDACDRARIPDASFHVLRHTSASHLVMSGVPVPVVAQNLGHADTRMTERHYAHLAPSYVAETIRKFAPSFNTFEMTNVLPVEQAQ
jgi:integrase